MYMSKITQRDVSFLTGNLQDCFDQILSIEDPRGPSMAPKLARAIAQIRDEHQVHTGQ